MKWITGREDKSEGVWLSPSFCVGDEAANGANSIPSASDCDTRASRGVDGGSDRFHVSIYPRTGRLAEALYA